MRFRNIVIAFVISASILLIFAYFGGFFTNKGFYIISNQWIGNESSNGIKQCDNCLWIDFDGGCNKHTIIYFENQHEFDKRLSVGLPVDIKWRNCGENKRCVKEVIPRKEYLYKCST